MNIDESRDDNVHAEGRRTVPAVRWGRVFVELYEGNIGKNEVTRALSGQASTLPIGQQRLLQAADLTAAELQHYLDGYDSYHRRRTRL